MKKILLFLIVVVALVFVSDKVYKWYSKNNINAHESIVLINDHFSENEVDAFFNLTKGTYDPNKYQVIYSLIKKDAYLLETYINLPTKYNNGSANNNQFNCDVEYLAIRQYGFYQSEIGNTNIIARIILKGENPIKQLHTDQIIAEKQLGATYSFGKINILDIGKNGVANHCK